MNILGSGVIIYLRRNTMNIYLLKFGFYGIKNIKENIELTFYKKTVDKSFDPSLYKVKSIYGENGSGKTAIVTAFSILKKLIVFPDYLSDSNVQEKLRHIVNKEKNEFRLYADVCVYSEEVPIVFSYEIMVKKNQDTEIFEIYYEHLKAKKATYGKALFHDVFVIENGEFNKLETDEHNKEIIKIKTMNLLARGSGIAKIMELIENKKVNYEAELFYDVILVQGIFLRTLTFLNDEDEHYLFYTKKNFERIRDIKNATNEGLDKAFFQINEIISSQTNKVKKNAISSYENKIKKLTRFIQIFKTSLKDIMVEKKEMDADYYQVSLVFDYGSYSVDYEFESTGIKKMVKLYDAIQSVTMGFIVFIDEFDANINPVFFDKLIDYVRDFADGQLAFTSHNTSSMESLKDGKDAINFLTSDNQIIKWTKNGHYSPDVLYRNGMIEKIPFNIYGTDFVGIFGEYDE